MTHGPSNVKLMTVLSVGTVLFHADGPIEPDMTKLKVAFRNFAKIE